MALGLGKYDDLCTYVREQAGVGEATGGGVIVIVMGGKRGTGFSCQGDLATMLVLPDLLENVARQIRSDNSVMYALGHGYCIGCGQLFSFNPMRVPSIPIKGSREPICQNCVERVNPTRIANGLDPIVPHPDAYEPCDESELEWDR